MRQTNKTIAVKVVGVRLRDTLDGSETTLDLEGLLIAIGADPCTHLVHGKLDINSDGTIAVQERSSRTSIDPTCRQAVTAAGSGKIAALDAERCLASLPAAILAQVVTAP